MCGVNLKACSVIKVCSHVASGVAPLLALCSVPMLPPCGQSEEATLPEVDHRGAAWSRRADELPVGRSKRNFLNVRTE